MNFWLPVEGSDNFAFLATSTRLATYAYTGFYSSEWGSYQDDLADIASSVPKPSSMKLTFEFLVGQTTPICLRIPMEKFVSVARPWMIILRLPESLLHRSMPMRC